MIRSESRRRAAGMALFGIVALTRLASAQAVSSSGNVRELESRATLEAEARAAETQHRTAEAFLLRSRLTKGDFQDGDRIVVALLGTTTYNDTITVRAGRMLPLPKMADLPLEGVLRSELTERLSSHLAKYLRDSSVRATPLVRLAILGSVRSPGYYYTSADVLLSDVIMKAGGPAQDANIPAMMIRRGGETIWNAQDTRAAVSDGLSLDRLHLRAGDEVYLPQQTSRSYLQLFSVVTGMAGLILAIAQISRR
jgi:hypothetical protein